MRRETLFDNGHHQWLYLGRDPNKPDNVIDTNQYVILNGEKAFLMDPGGTEIFPAVLSHLSEVIRTDQITGYLCSHQDPDIMSSLPLWMELTPKARIYLSWLWGGFVSHFGHEYAKSFELIPDQGQIHQLGDNKLLFVPAHHCHSAGNFHLYDPEAKILFSGDVGAALVPDQYPIFVEDFDEHVRYMEKFHKRWMPSNEAKSEWIRRVDRLDIEMICPQHGAIFRGPDVKRFLHWFDDLRVGLTAA